MPGVSGTAKLRQAEDILEYRFRDPALLELALSHRSHAHNLGQGRLASYERLEFLGDAVLGMVVSEHLYRSFPEREEGELTRMKARLVCGATLSLVAQELGLHELVLMSRSEEATGGRTRTSIRADVVEAVLGAVFLDGGLAPAADKVEAWIITHQEALLRDEVLGNHKSRLQEVVQSRFKMPPRYHVREVSGPDHERSFHVEVSVRSRSLGEGRGSSKKAAEQAAAARALAAWAEDPKLLDPTEDA